MDIECRIGETVDACVPDARISFPSGLSDTVLRRGKYPEENFPFGSGERGSPSILAFLYGYRADYVRIADIHPAEDKFFLSVSDFGSVTPALKMKRLCEIASHLLRDQDPSTDVLICPLADRIKSGSGSIGFLETGAGFRTINALEGSDQEGMSP